MKLHVGTGHTWHYFASITFFSRLMRHARQNRCSHELSYTWKSKAPQASHLYHSFLPSKTLTFFFCDLGLTDFISDEIDNGLSLFNFILSSLIYYSIYLDKDRSLNVFDIWPFLNFSRVRLNLKLFYLYRRCLSFCFLWLKAYIYALVNFFF